MEVEIVYHSKPARRVSQQLSSQKRFSNALQLQTACPQALAHESRSHVGLEDCPSDRMLDAVALKVSSSVHVVPSSVDWVLCFFSSAADSDSVPAEFEAGLKGVQVDDGGASHCSVDDGGASYSTLVDPDGAHQDLVNPSCDLDQLEWSPMGLLPAENCLEYEVDDSTLDSIARITRKYSLVDSDHIVPIKVSPGHSLIGGQLGKA
ncbi:hypothetical protein Nepgr_032222 [Nepenthes gracilis]|uniref:Uncharacterized protein n=1 Tax=Nepenthes gracilis TaxID=150966 RepID=A0AAD3TJP7_NEPGR|nr:hypothetical protein Nepgr_032222 [Nepenthes gracilis]